MEKNMKLIYVIKHNSYGILCAFEKTDSVVTWIKENVENYLEFKMFADDTIVAEIELNNPNTENIHYRSVKSFMETFDV
jgi:hypothetical protein